MKKIALILVLCFTALQVVPAICSLFSPALICEVVDEGKGEEKKDTDSKDHKKDFTIRDFQIDNFSSLVFIAFHQADKIYPHPCIEKQTPPPNFC